MKTITTITVIGLLAWIGFVVYNRANVVLGLEYWSYFETYLVVSPAILAGVAIGKYYNLNKSIANYQEEIGINDLRFLVDLVIASVVSLFTFIFNAKNSTVEYGVGPLKPDQYDWILMILSGLIGLAVLIFFYWRTSTTLEKEKKTIDQQRLEKEAHLLQQERTQQAFLEASKDLFHNPEQSPETLHSKHEFLESGAPRKIAVETLKKFINERSFHKAGQLLDYYDIDAHQLLPVVKALDKYERDTTIDLKPTNFKLTLENGETAYEKLPCNWQKIHTYLAPLEDEIEQADILDSGNIYITDQRVFFVGKKGSETVYLNDIAYMDHKEDALQFFRDEGLSEIFAFPTPHHATYARLVIEELMGR